MATTLTLLPPLTASAAPAVEPPVTDTEQREQDSPPEELTPEDRARAQVRELFARGMEKFKAEDYTGAIEPWQEAYDMVTLCRRTELFVPLGSAHWFAYQADGDEEHLHQARAMFTRGLEAIGTLNEQTRRDTEVQLAEVDAELARLEALRVKAERERAARDAVEQERARQRERELAEQRARAEQERRRFRLSMALGGATAGLGALSLGVMVAPLALGARVERQGAQLASDPTAGPIDLWTLQGPGTTYNRLAWTAGAIGGALVVSGATVMLIALIQRRHTKSPTRARMTSWRAGAVLSL